MLLTGFSSLTEIINKGLFCSYLLLYYQICITTGPLLYYKLISPEHWKHFQLKEEIVPELKQQILANILIPDSIQ